MTNIYNMDLYFFMKFSFFFFNSTWYDWSYHVIHRIAYSKLNYSYLNPNLYISLKFELKLKSVCKLYMFFNNNKK